MTILPLRPPPDYESEPEVTPAPAPEPASEGGAGGVPVLPEAFWAARPSLEHIRTAARSRLLAPDGVLGACLALVCANADWRFRLPAVVGAQGSLNVAMVLVAPSGGGKGGAFACANALLAGLPHSDDHRMGVAPLGSGEGLVRSFYDQITDPDGGPKAPKVWVQGRRGLLLRVDEAELLKALGARTGSTVTSLLRQGWSGETLGFAYVGESGQFRLPAWTYRLALLVALQPEVARFAFDDAAGGTPQRWTWVDAGSDREAPDLTPAWPGRLPVSDFPTWASEEQWATTDSEGLRHVVMQVDPLVVAEIVGQRRKVLRGEIEVDPLDSHASLARLKIAGLLAMLDGRVGINREDWWLAWLVESTSRQVRTWVAGQLRAAERKKDRASAERAGERAEASAVGDAAGRARLDRVARVLAHHLENHSGERCTRSCLRRAVASRERALFEGAEGIAVERGWLVVEADGEYRAGDSRPAPR